MAKAKAAEAAKKRRAEGAGELSKWRELEGWRAAAALGFATLIFYWIPLTDPQTSIQWDAVDVHYSSQKYFAERALHGELPFWTPYIFSGFPFLADLQVGAWYPLNWPFFLAGITPRAIELEIALHALLAGLGAFLLLSRMIRLRLAALIGAVAYAFSGYFADHSSHVGMFQAASLTPWLLLCFHRGMERRTVSFTALGGLVGGAIVLAGHFQNALYAFVALGLFAAAYVFERPLRAVATLAGIVALTIGLSAIQTLPGLALSRLSIRSAADYSQTRERILRPAALLDILLPKAAGGGSEVSQESYYLYGGLLLLPLAALGLRNRGARVAALLLVVPPLWYMLGPDFGLYRLGAIMPLLHRVRAPIHLWFVAALGLAMLAGAGAEWIFERWRSQAALWAIAALMLADLFYWNSLTNIRAYARYSFDDLYGNTERVAESKLVPTLPPLTRYDAPDFLTMFGPLNHPLDLRLEATYGYNPLALTAYAEYREAMKRNPKLAAGLGVSRYLDAELGAARPLPDSLPRAYFARSVIAAKDDAESLRLLESLDPGQATVVAGGAPAAPDGIATIAADGEQGYRVHYRVGSPALLKLSVPYFPGWAAAVDGARCEIVRADHALMGILVPAGEKDLLVRFHSDNFALGAGLSAVSAAVALALLLRPLPKGEERAKMAG